MTAAERLTCTAIALFAGWYVDRVGHPGWLSMLVALSAGGAAWCVGRLVSQGNALGEEEEIAALPPGEHAKRHAESIDAP